MHMKRIVLIGLIILTGGLAAFARQSEWQKQIAEIKPLLTTKKQVEGILKCPIGGLPDSDTAKYQTAEGVFTIKYSPGNCESNNKSEWDVDSKSEWDVEKGVVIRAFFSPQTEFKFDLLEIDMSLFSTNDPTDNPDATTVYHNSDKSISFAKSRGLLDWMETSPGNEQELLQCSR